MKTTLLATALLVIIPAAASGQSVSEISGEIDGFDARVTKLEQNYLKPARLASRYQAEAKYNDARVAYATKDFSKASILLIDVVHDENFKRSQQYREALFILGDSLFQMRNYVAAQRYFELVVGMGAGQHYDESVGRLLEIAYETRNFERLDELNASLQGNMTPATSYLSGKSYYERGNYEQARQSFARAAQDPEWTMRANYFTGVTYVAEKRLGDAKRTFDAVVNSPPQQNEVDTEVVNLSWLALGRLAYEEGDVELAIDYYGRPPRTSQHFDRALWEQTWVFVSRGNYEAARRHVDILLYLPQKPDPDLLAEARLLRADLSLKLGEYDAARADYQAVLDKYGPANEQMNQFVSQHQDLPAFFAALVEQELSGSESSYLPELVEEWVRNDPDMRESSRLLTEAGQLERDLQDSHRMLDEISTRLTSSTRARSFPELAEGLTKGIEAEMRLLELRRKLLGAQYSKVQGQISGADATRWQGHAKALERMDQRLDEMAQTSQSIAEREKMLTSEFARLRQRLGKIEQEIESQKIQLTAVNRYMGDEEGRPLTTRERDKLQAYRADLKRQIDQLTRLHQEVEQEVARNREMIGVGDAVMLAEAQVRSEYRQTLADAAQFLSKFGGGSSIEAARSKIAPLERRLDAYFAKMNSAIDTKVGEHREAIAAERELIDSHRESMSQLVSASEGGAGVLAYLNFMRARAEFGEIILRGDVGVIDVVWKKKEDMSNKISKLFEDRTSELNLLQEAFEEVR